MMLEINNLTVRIGAHVIVEIDYLEVSAGSRLGIVGESGSGKTMTAMSILRLLPQEAEISGSITFDGVELVGMSERELTKVRGNRIGVVFQDSAKALNPMMRIGRQVSEVLRLHQDMSSAEVDSRVLELLSQVKLPQPESLIRRYPHQLSGGQQQRVLIAIAIACNPKLLIADEPTTALDVTVQDGILDLIKTLSVEQQMGLVFVSHDLGVVQNVSEHLAVVYGGQLVESGRTSDILANPRHRYTSALIAANPGIPNGPEIEFVLDQRLDTIPGTVPALGKFPNGCRFRGRCGSEIASCQEVPPTTRTGRGASFKCWNPAGVTPSTNGSINVIG